MASLGEELPRAIKAASAWRDEMLLFAGQMGERGNGCRLSATIAGAFINEAVAALASGDVVRMLRAYENIKDYVDDDIGQQEG